MQHSVQLLATTVVRTVVGARQLVTIDANPRLVASTGTVVTGTVTVTIRNTSTHGAVLSSVSLIAEAHLVVADTVIGAGVGACMTRAVNSRVPNIAVAGAVDTVSMIGAAVGAFLCGALSSSPSLETVACTVEAFAVMVTVSWASADGAINTDPSRLAQTRSIETASSERAIVRADVTESDDRAILSSVSGEAFASSIVARSLSAAVVRAFPGRRSAIGTREAISAGTDTTDTHSVIRAHVGAHSGVMVYGAIWAGESSGADALASLGIAVTVVAAVIGTDLNFTSDTSVSHTAVATSLEARPVTAAQVRAIADRAAWS